MADQSWWITPALALAGALLGGYLAARANGTIAERRAERALVREARVALERWHATRVGPSNVQYPGLSGALLAEVTDDAHRNFFQNHFAETSKAKAALGAVRHLDPRIADVLDAEGWAIPVDRVNDLRDALSGAEKLALRGRVALK